MIARLRQALFGIPLLGSHTQHPFNGPTLPTAVAANRSLATMPGTETATFAAGCFWGTQKLFSDHYKNKGIKKLVVGYTGGRTDSPSYRQVCSGTTEHAEALKIDFDPSQVSYAELVEFFYRTHDATQLNRQGPDVGSQYRSGIFTHSPQQLETAKKVTQEVQEKHYGNKKIVTVVQEAGKWWDAEDYHQDYLDNNPGGVLGVRAEEGGAEEGLTEAGDHAVFSNGCRGWWR